MATQTGLFPFTGRVGNVIGYRRNGKYFFRSMPEKVNRSEASRRAAKDFGIASRNGSLIRHAFKNELDIRCNGTLTNRLNKALIQKSTAIEGFRFNQHTSLHALLPHPPAIRKEKGQFHVHIPAQEILHSTKATHIRVKAIIAEIDFTKGIIITTASVMHLANIRGPFAGAELTLPCTGKGTAVILLQVHECQEENGQLQVLGNRKYYAADILSVVSPLPAVSPAVPKPPANRKPVIKRLPEKPQYTNRTPLRKTSPPGKI